MRRAVLFNLLCKMRICKLHGKIRFYFILTVLLLFIVGASLTALLPKVDHDEVGVLRRDSWPRQQQHSLADSFTIIMQTYNRTDLLLKLLNHYQAVPHLHKVIIVWNNIGEKIPRELWDSLGPHPVPIVFKEQTVNRMRNRLQFFPELETEAVLMLDDDTLQFPDQIVGFVPRKHISAPSGIYSYGSFELQNPEGGNGDKYSMVLIGAAFFHRTYLEKFQKLPSEVHSLIDETQNCDDIAMNFVVAKHTRRPSGVFVKPVDMRNHERDASSGYTGMWHRAEHLLQRSYCLNKLADIYGSMPLQYSNIMISQFGFPSYANHMSKN